MKKIDKFDGTEYGFLSNFYSSPIEYKGIKYPTVEHMFQALKSLNPMERMEIAAAATPGKAKRLGRRVSLRSDWEEIKIDVMRTALQLKFSDPVLRKKLIATISSLAEETYISEFYRDRIKITTVIQEPVVEEKESQEQEVNEPSEDEPHEEEKQEEVVTNLYFGSDYLDAVENIGMFLLCKQTAYIYLS